MVKNSKSEEEIVSQEMKERLRSHLLSKERLFGHESPFSELLQDMVNELLEGEMEAFQADQKTNGKRNKRNGRTHKQVLSDTGPIWVSTPRDRNGEFEPELIGKRQRELSSGLDEQIIALYA